MDYVVVGLYTLALLFIFFFSIGQFHLTLHYLRALRRKRAQRPEPFAEADWPMITVQLPIYNELYVVERLLDSVGVFDYPADRLEIQVLDDSTDETKELTARKVAEWQAKGVNMQHVLRPDRVGYKAGALQYGMERAAGEFIAIFDADFLPEPDFLKLTVPYFRQPEVGVVQTRWGHVNQDYSFLTKLQAFGLDAHFTVEQGGRNAAESFINFNGTAGLWRKQCIVDAGGWSHDTLTEDLDLSYRAQLKGWKFQYLEHVEAPAELPVLMPAIKSQQYRWNKGGAQTARKNLGKVLRTPLGFKNKLHAFFHLLNSSVFLCILLSALLSIPMLYIKADRPEMKWIFEVGSVFLLGFLAIAFFYWVAARQLHPKKTGFYFFTTFPLFLMVSMGLSLHNAVAVAEGLLGRKSAFIRTPKFNVREKKDSLKGNIYAKSQISWLTLLEGMLSLYFIFGVISGIQLGDYGLILFHGFLAAGFALIFYHSVRPFKYA